MDFLANLVASWVLCWTLCVFFSARDGESAVGRKLSFLADEGGVGSIDDVPTCTLARCSARCALGARGVAGSRDRVGFVGPLTTDSTLFSVCRLLITPAGLGRVTQGVSIAEVLILLVGTGGPTHVFPRERVETLSPVSDRPARGSCGGRDGGAGSGGHSVFQMDRFQEEGRNVKARLKGRCKCGGWQWLTSWLCRVLDFNLDGFCVRVVLRVDMSHMISATPLNVREYLGRPP